MKIGRWLFLFGTLTLSVLGIGLLLIGVSAAPSVVAGGVVEGVVVDAEGPVAGAVVRERATDNATSTANDGRFTLTSLIEGQGIEITAWSDGYYIASTHVTPTVSGVTLTLRPYHAADHPDYEWVVFKNRPFWTVFWLGSLDTLLQPLTFLGNDGHAPPRQKCQF